MGKKIFFNLKTQNNGERCADIGAGVNNTQKHTRATWGVMETNAYGHPRGDGASSYRLRDTGR